MRVDFLYLVTLSYTVFKCEDGILGSDYRVSLCLPCPRALVFVSYTTCVI